VMANYPKTAFAGAITDNTSTNKNAWEKLSKKYPSAYFQGCTSHGLHLFVEDVFAATKTRKVMDLERTYPIATRSKICSTLSVLVKTSSNCFTTVIHSRHSCRLNR
jgi:hypothetical protein